LNSLHHNHRINYKENSPLAASIEEEVHSKHEVQKRFQKEYEHLRKTKKKYAEIIAKISMQKLLFELKEKRI
jgi:molecular chaperone GrpE (heat shock protein)